MNCIFCKITKKEVASDMVYEDNHVFAFLDSNPINKGHVLVIHKQHHENMLVTPDKELCAIIIAAKKVGKAVMQGVHADGFNIGINTKPAAGQVVMHTHIHVIPRFSNDGLKHWPGKPYLEGEGKTVAQSIKKHL
jgi:histidine triad (HIT) family protein